MSLKNINQRLTYSSIPSICKVLVLFTVRFPKRKADGEVEYEGSKVTKIKMSKIRTLNATCELSYTSAQGQKIWQLLP